MMSCWYALGATARGRGEGREKARAVGTRIGRTSLRTRRTPGHHLSIRVVV